MNKFRQWYWRNSTEITWFLMGWLAMCLLEDFARGNWIGVVWDAALICLNLAVNNR
jgi:hypothetical protein